MKLKAKVVFKSLHSQRFVVSEGDKFVAELSTCRHLDEEHLNATHAALLEMIREEDSDATPE